MLTASAEEKRSFQIIPLLISAAVIGLLVWYLTRTDLFADINLKTLRWEYFAGVLATQVILYVLRGYLLYVFTLEHGIRIRFDEWFGLAIVSTISNILLPFGGGIGARAGYLKVRYGYPLEHFAAQITVAGILIFSVSGFAGLVVLLLTSLFTRTLVPLTPALIMVGIALGPLTPLVLPLQKLPLPAKGRIGKITSRALEGWAMLRSAPALLAQVVAVIVAMQFLLAASLWFALLGLGQSVNYLDTLLVGIFANTATIIRITPNGVGIGEAVAGVTAELVGFTAAQGVAAQLVSRLGAWVLLVVLGPPFIYVLSRRMQQSIVEAVQSEDQAAAD